MAGFRFGRARQCHTMSSMSRSNVTISLTPQLKRYVDRKVSSGGYQSVSELVREGLRLLQSRELDELDRRRARRDIEAGWNQSMKDDLIDGDVAYASLMKRLKQKKARK